MIAVKDPVRLRAICFGELLVDLVSQSPDRTLGEATCFLKAPGGAPANVAAGLSRLGTPVGFVGQVGEDPFGHWLREVLQAEGVDIKFLSRNARARTTLAFVATRQDGLKDVCFYRHPGADAQLRVVDLDYSMFESVSFFHCGGVSLSQSPCREAQIEAAREAKRRGLMISYDPNWRPSLWENHEEAHEILWKMLPVCDLVKLAEEEWEFFTGTRDLAKGAALIRAAGPRLVVVTLGKNGAFFSLDGAQGEVGGCSVTAVDTLGAGDAFMAGLLHRALSYIDPESLFIEANLRQDLRFANACGALATKTPGAIPALPSPQMVVDLLHHTSQT